MKQIRPELLNEFKRKGELLIIWRCEHCYKTIPFYKSNMSLVNMIYLAWAHDHKYCPKCEDKINGIDTTKKKPEIPRINNLLEIYESEEEDF